MNTPKREVIDLINRLKSKPNLRLVELRVSRGMTQRELALAWDVSEATIRNLEKGRALPGIELLLYSATFFGIPVSDLWAVLTEQLHAS